MRKLGIHENVLDMAEDETGNEAGDDSESEKFENNLDHSSSIMKMSTDEHRGFFRTLTGISVPAVTPAEMNEIERIAGIV